MPMKIPRRQFLQSAGCGTVVAALNRLLPNWLVSQASAAETIPSFFGSFTPLLPSLEDRIGLPEGFEHEILLKRGDLISPDGARFGDHNDYLAWIVENETRGWLWVNHENSHQLHGEELLRAVGGSCLRIVKSASGVWRPLLPSAENFRVDGLDTRIQLTGPAAGSKWLDGAREVRGSVANCGGAVSPWGTFFSGEENFKDFFGDPDHPDGADVPVHKLPNELRRNSRHFGYMVEIDPATREIFKHTALGRFAHENVAFRTTSDGRLAAYLGDDREGCYLFKYISKGRYEEAKGKANRELLYDGVLHAADTKNGRWIPLDPQQTPMLKEKGFDAAQICVQTRWAARHAGATPMARPEDVEVHPQTGEVFVCLTSYPVAGGFPGAILALREEANDAGALAFQSEILIAGGKANDLSCPDNLQFTERHELLVTTDYNQGKSTPPEPGTTWSELGNNFLTVLETSGPRRGKARRFMNAPLGAELCSPTLSPAGNELWVSVQHPGETGLGSWPEAPGGEARSALIAVQRKA